MWEPKNYNFKLNTSISRAMSVHNKIMTGPRFNTLDAAILNLVKSFSETNTKFFISNKELGEILVADPSTVQRSVDRLIASGLISKQLIYVGQKPQRLLTVVPQAIDELLKLC